MAFKAGAIWGEARLDTKKWTGGLKRMGKTAGIAVAAISAAFIAGMVKVTKAADEYQKAMSNVASIVDTTAINMQELSMSLLRLDPALGKTTDLTKGLYQAFSAGAETAEEALDVTVQSAIVAKAAITDIDTAVLVLSSSINAWGKDVLTAQQVSDLFFKTVKTGQITGAQLAETIGQSTALFASAGLSLKDLTSGIAALTKVGVPAAQTTTQLNAIVNAFLKPSEQMTKALESIGFESGSAFLKVNDLTEIMGFLESQTKGDAAAIANLIPNIRGMRGAMALTGVGGIELSNIFEEMEDAVGSSQEAFEKQEKTFATLASSLDKVQIVTGNIAKHFVDKIAVGATTAANSLLQFVMSAQGMNFVADVAGVVAGTFEVLKGIVEPLFEVIKDSFSEVWEVLIENLTKLVGEGNESNVVFKILAGIVTAISAAFRIWSSTVSLVITGIVDLALAIGDTAALFGKFFEAIINPTKWGEVGEQFDKTKKAFVTFGKGVVDNTKELIDIVIEEFMGFSEATDKLAKDLEISYTVSSKRASDNVKANWGEMISGMAPFLEGLQQQIFDVNKKTEDDAKETTDDLKATWEDYFNWVSTGFSTLASSIFNVTSQVYTNEEAKLQLSLQNQITDLEEARDAGIITEEEFGIRKEEIETKVNEKLNEVAQKQFESNKVNKIANIWIDTASAIQGFWASVAGFGPIAGPIFAAAMSALVTGSAIAQSALIGKQVFVPSLAEGGRASGLTRVHEAGGEMMVLPDNTIVYPHDISRQIASSVGREGNTISVSFAGANISDNISMQKIVDTVITKLGRELRLAG